MAIDDVVSNYETQVSSGGTLSVQPLSGDEWLVTCFFVETEWRLISHSDTGVNYVGLWGGDTSAGADIDRVGIRDTHKFFVTNSEYIRLVNNDGATRSGGYSAIKTKE